MRAVVVTGTACKMNPEQSGEVYLQWNGCVVCSIGFHEVAPWARKRESKRASEAESEKVTAAGGLEA